MPGSQYRTNSGPAPDPNALKRSTKTDAASWIRLPGKGLAQAPPWPQEAIDGDAPPIEAAFTLWDRIWTTYPQAHIWRRQRLEMQVAVYVQTVMTCTRGNPTPPMLTSMRQQSDALLINPLAMRAARVVIDEALEEVVEEVTTLVGVAPVLPFARPSVKDRLGGAQQAVADPDPDEDDEEGDDFEDEPERDLP